MNLEIPSDEKAACNVCGEEAIEKFYVTFKGDKICSRIHCRHCEEIREEKERWQAECRERKRIDGIKESSGLVGLLQLRTLESFKANFGEQENALKIARQFSETGEPRWLAFVGKTGTGKSHLALGVVSYCIEQKSKACLYTKLIQITRRFRATFNNYNETEESVAKYYKELDLLVIDEFGLRTAMSDWERATLDDILDSRWEQEKRTIIVSNMTAKKLFEMTGDRIESRFADVGSIVSFTWDDYRKAKKA